MTGLLLPVDPLDIADGNDIAVGTYEIVRVGAGGCTVRRRIGFATWYPRINGDWLRFRSIADATKWAMTDPDDPNLFTCSGWPLWGAA